MSRNWQKRIGEAQADKWRKTGRFEQEAPNASSSSSTHVSLEYPASGEKQDRLEPVLSVENKTALIALEVKSDEKMEK